MTFTKSRCAVPIFDRLMASALLLFMGPGLLMRMLWQRLRLVDCFEDKAFHIGLGETFNFSIYRDRPERKAPLLMQVVKGRLALVGTRMISCEEIEDVSDMDFAELQFSVCPGLFSLFELRRRTGLDFCNEQECNLEFLDNRSASVRMSILLRSILADFLYRAQRTPRDVAEFEVLGVRIDNWSMQQSINAILSTIDRGIEKTVFFANAHTLNLSYASATFRKLLNDVDVLLPDGSGIEVACRRLGVRRKGNVNGTDMLPLLCAGLADAERSVFLLGGEEGIAAAAADKLKADVPGLNVVDARHGFFDQVNCGELIAEINAAQPSVLMVGMGQPLQERWVSENRHRLNVPVVMAVGGLFDFYAEKVSRAPVWLRELGLEWIWRLLQEPGRMWRRYVIGNPLFLLRIRRARPH